MFLWVYKVVLCRFTSYKKSQHRLMEPLVIQPTYFIQPFPPWHPAEFDWKSLDFFV